MFDDSAKILPITVQRSLNFDAIESI